MTVEIGHKIKEVFDHQNMKLTDFADELGTVRQNVYRIFKKRHLDTGLLLKISQVLNHNFFQYYISSSEGGDLHQGAEIKRLNQENMEHQRQLELAKKEIDYLRKIIKLMEEKAELVQQVGKDTMVLH
jgi:transcriptional regulator with XRE-family HTH domain